MHISVILCTHNRSDGLRLTLQACCEMEIPTGLQWELLVVDNNSTDATKQVCEEFSGQLPVRYIFEPHQGQTIARNRGVREARAPLIAFTDDDVSVDRGWIRGLWKAAEAVPEACFFGGKIIPKWETPPPSWLLERSQAQLVAVAMHLDKGDVARFLTDKECPFFGANMAFRKCLFTEGHLFREDLGLRGDDSSRGDDTEFIQRLTSLGYRGWYQPSMIVYHRNPAHRTTEKYLRSWFKGNGMKEARLQGPPSAPCWFGAPRYLWGQLLTSFTRYFISRPFCRADIWLPAEIRMARAWGAISEYRRLARAKPKHGGER